MDTIPMTYLDQVATIDRTIPLWEALTIERSLAVLSEHTEVTPALIEHIVAGWKRIAPPITTPTPVELRPGMNVNVRYRKGSGDLREYEAVPVVATTEDHIGILVKSGLGANERDYRSLSRDRITFIELSHSDLAAVAEVFV